MSEPAKPLNPTPTPAPASGVEDDPVLAAIRRAPFREATDQERELLEEWKDLHTHYITTEEMMATVNAMRPVDATDDDLDDEE
jgi:hypothetical protein